MREECITAVRKAAGEMNFSDAEIQHIESALKEAWEQEGSKNAGFSNFSLDKQINTVSNRAKENFFSDASRLKPYELLAGLDDKSSQISQVRDRIRHRLGGGGSIEGAIGQAKRDINNRFLEFNKYGSLYLGFKNDLSANTDLLLALRGDKNVRPEALEIAKVFHEAMDRLVKEAKAVGIKFHPLENYTPQPMDFWKISTVTKEEFVDRTLPRLDIAEYQRRGINDESSLRSFVGEVYETDASEGRNKTIASLGKKAGYAGSLGGRLRQVRQLHYTPQGLVSAMKEFGSEVTIDGMMNRSFDNLIRDIEVAREFGANASESFEFVLAHAYEKDRKNRISRSDTKSKLKGLDKLRAEEAETREYFDRLTRGKAPPTSLDKATDVAMASQVITKFGTQVFYTPIEAINAATLASHRMGLSWKKTAKGIWDASPLSGKEKKEFLKHITVGVEHARTGLSHDLETSTRGVMGVMADKAMDWPGLTAMDNMLVRGSSAAFQSYVGEITRNFQDMNSLKKKIGEQPFNSLIENHRFTERDLRILSLAEPESFKGKGTYLTDKNIYNIPDEKLTSFLKPLETEYRLKSDLANKYRTLIWSTVQEHLRGSVSATLQDTKYVAMSKGLGRNLLRLMFQFIIMPVSFLRMHLIEAPNSMVGGGWGLSANVYRAKFAAISLVGEELIRNVLIPIISGREPRFDYTDPMEYAKAVLRATLHYERWSPVGGGSSWDILGAAPGQMGRLINSAVGAFNEDNRRKKGKAQAKFVNEVLNTFVPYQNIWYTKAAFNHYVRDSLAEMVNPGGKARAEANLRKKREREARRRCKKTLSNLNL